MTIESTNISFYRITQCGYFARGADAPLFGSVQEVLEDLQQWSAGKKLVETKISEVEQADTNGNTYLLDIQTKGGTWMIATWNETASTNGRVASVQGESNVGDATIHMNDIVEGSIPGYSTYFWVIPSRNIFASIRFHHPYTAQRPFRSYIEKFMECYSRHVVVGEPTEDSDYPIIGYSNTAEDEPRHLYPRFRTEWMKKPGQKQFFLDNADRITKIIRKETLDLSQAEPLAVWQKLLRQARLSNPQQVPIKPRISFDVPFQPTAQDIEKMFEAWEEESESKWDDFGVKIAGHSDTHWVSHTLARQEFDLDVVRDNDEVVNTISLLDALLQNRAQILAVATP